MDIRNAVRRAVAPACLALVLAGCAATSEDTDTLPAPTGGPEPISEVPAQEDGATANVDTTDPR